MVFSAQSFATSTMLIKCHSSVRTSTQYWVYSLEGYASYNRSLGFSSFQRNPEITVTKITNTSNGPVGETFVEKAPLSPTTNGASYLGFKLPESLLGLDINYYPDSSVESGGSWILWHEYAPGKTNVSGEKDQKCSAEEIG